MRQQTCKRWFFLTVFSVVTAALVQPHESHADILYDLIPEPDDFGLLDFDHFGTLTRDGVTAKFTGHSDEGLFGILGKVRISTGSFGVSIVDATDQDELLIDGGNSDTFGFVAERMLISFDQAVTVDEITLRFLGSGESARLLDPDTLSVYLDVSGSANDFDTFDLSSQNIVLSAGQNIGVGYLNGTGFALKSIRVSAVPEPNTLFLVSMTGLVVGLRRRRRTVRQTGSWTRSG